MKKSITKILATVLSLVLLISSFNLVIVYATGDNSPNITVGTATGKAGETVNVAISLSNNPGIIAMYLDLSYDTTRLKLTGVTNGSVFGAGTLFTGNNYNTVPFSLNFSDDIATSNIENNGTLVTLSFEILENAPVGDANVTVSYDPNEVYDVNVGLVSFGITAGSVTVQPPAMTGISMKSDPTKTVYKEGEALDVSGAEITVSYENDTSKDIAVTDAMVSGYTSSPGNKTIKVTYAENGITKETSFNVVVNAKQLVSIRADSVVGGKTTYIEGETFDKNAIRLMATYDNNSTAEIEQANYTVSPGILTLGTNQVTLSYLGKTCTYNITVNAKTLQSIEVTTYPTKTAYKLGESFSASGGKLTLTYDNGSTEIIDLTDAMCTGYNARPETFVQQVITVNYNGKQTNFNVMVNDRELVDISIKTQPAVKTFIEGNAFAVDGTITLNYDNGDKVDKDITVGMCSGYNMNHVGAQTVTITESGKTATYQITVEAKSLTGIVISTPPAKTTYIEGQIFDKTGMVVTASYNNDTTAFVTNYSVDKTTLALGDSLINVTYIEDGITKESTTPIVVNAKQLTSISINKQPNKTEYIEGQIFDKAGMIVKANYDNNTSETITAYTVPSDKLTVGQSSVEVSYNGKTARVTISVRAKTLQSISMKSNPSKTAYIEGQALDLTGGFITLNYDNGDKAEKAVTSEMVTGYDANKIGTQTLTVTENGKTTVFVVTVTAKGVASISMKKTPGKTTYIEGQALDLTGASITVSYDNGTSADIPVTEEMVSEYNKDSIGSQTVTVTYGNKTTTFNVTVNAKTLSEITLNSSSVKKLYLEGTDLDIAGLTLTAQYDNDTTEQVNVTLAMVSGYDKDTVGEQAITVTYGGMSESYTVTVSSRATVDEIIQAIADIVIDDITVNDKDEILLLQEQFDALSDLEKSAVSASDVDKLAKSVEKINELLFPAFDEWSDETVNVKAVQGVLPYGTVLRVTNITASAGLLNDIRATYGANSVFAGYYDVELLDLDGAAITSVNGKLTVQIKLSDEYADGTDVVVVLVGEDGKSTVVNATFTNGYAVFETDRLGQYGIVKKIAATSGENTSNPPDSTEVSSPQTGDKDMTFIWIMFFASLIGLVSMLALRKKSARRYN